MATYENLDVWQLSHEQALSIYKLSKEFPSDEKFGLASQVRRAATPVPLNIAEGNVRLTKGEHKQFLSFAKGSNEEVHYLLRLSKDLGYVLNDTYEEMTANCDRISQMLTKLTHAIRE